MQDAITLELPFSKAVITLKGFITTGQSRELQRVLLSHGEFDPSNPSGAMKNMKPEAVLEMQDKAAEMLIINVRQNDVDQPFTKEWLYNLPMQDGNAVYEKINELIGATANLSEDAKKK